MFLDEQMLNNNPFLLRDPTLSHAGGGHKVPGLGLRLALTPLGSKLRAHTS